MASPSSQNRGYAPGSLAARPTKFAGGMRRRDESPEAFRWRMDAGRAPNAPAQPGAVAPTRRDNILTARTDGTFDAKVAAYNQAGQATGHSMDAAGNITAPSPTAVKPGGKLIPGHSPGSSIWQPDAPVATPTPTPTLPPTPSAVAAVTPPASQTRDQAAQIAKRNMVAKTGQAKGRAQAEAEAFNLFAEEQAKGVTPPVTNNVTRNVTSPVTPPSPSRNGGVMDAISQAAQGMQTAMTSQNPLAVVPRATAIHQTLQQRSATPSTTTPAGVPAPAPLAVNPSATPTGGKSLFTTAAQGVKTALQTGAGILDASQKAASTSRDARQPLHAKALKATAEATDKIVEGGVKLGGAALQGLNVGIPAMLSAGAAQAENLAKATAQKASAAIAPLRRAVFGSNTKSQAELDHEKLKALFKPKTGPRLAPIPAGSTPFPVSAITPKTLATRPTAQRSQLVGR